MTETELDDPLATALPHLLEQAVPDRRPPIHALVAGGLARGYRRRRLRRLGQVAGVAAAVVALSLPIGLVAHSVGDRPTAARAGASAQPSQSAGAAGPLVHSEQGLVEALVALLHTKGAMTWQMIDRVTGPAYGASVWFDDGHGQVLVTAAVWTSLASAGLPAAGDCTPGPECVTTALADGSVLYGRLGRDTTVHPTQVIAIAWLVRPDGTALSLGVRNAAGAEGSDVTRPAPTFTVVELVEMVQAPVWLAH
jgi:hypothetical protein